MYYLNYYVNPIRLLDMKTSIAYIFLAFFVLIGLTDIAQADQTLPYHVLNVEKFSYEHKWTDKVRDPFIPNERNWRYKDNLYWNVSIFKEFFWDNNVEMYSTDSKVLSVGWQFYMGVRVTDWLDIVKDHHSRHVMEEERPSHSFPVEDSYGFRLNFIK